MRVAKLELTASATSTPPPRPVALPLDAIETIMSHLSPREITTAAQVNRAWAEASRAFWLWGPLAQPPAPPVPPPRVAGLLVKQDKAMLMYEVLAGIGVAVGVFTAAELFFHFVERPRHQQALAACSSDCVENKLWFLSWNFVIIQTAPLWTLLVPLASMRARVKLAACVASRQAKRAQLRASQDAAQAAPVALKRAAMRSMHRWEDALVRLRQAIEHRDAKSVADILAYKPRFARCSDEALLEDGLALRNVSAAVALLEADYPPTPRCFDLAMDRGMPDIFGLLVRAVQKMPSSDFSTWISKGAFARAVEDRSHAIVKGAMARDAIAVLGPSAADYINSPLCAGGASPFFLAAQTNQRLVFRTMLQHGGDLDARVTQDGMCVAQIAYLSQTLRPILENHVPHVHICFTPLPPQSTHTAAAAR